ncbi:hypothetical protein PCANC_15764 [Puccinia coronata f. sp. avenae]|uniref:Uncharacterized protein n=1 Tax=Puccinia coronata f. sp. avenae TaxID=200324 RepID=A0A2N5TUS3_9BASI|nr:hypothetical protein PCANC_15764 [Puccinia coronata f. sp. avenae]
MIEEWGDEVNLTASFNGDMADMGGYASGARAGKMWMTEEPRSDFRRPLWTELHFPAIYMSSTSTSRDLLR